MDKKVCFIASSLPRWDPRFFERQAISLVINNFKVSCIVCDGLPPENINKIKITSSIFAPTNRFQRFFQSKRKLFYEAIKNNSDIYQISEPELIPVGLKLKKTGKKVIFDVREDYPELILTKEYIPKALRKIVAYILKMYISRALKKFDLVISVTPQLVEKLKRVNSNTILITNFPIINVNNTIALEDYLKRDNILCYIGTIYRISRQEITFRALEKINNIKYILAGRMEDNLYKNELINLSYWNKVDFINGITRNELTELYKRVTIGNSLRDFSETGYTEGSLGIIKIFEYMEASLPVVCSKVKLWEDIINKYNCGICVNPNDEKEIQRAIQYLIDHKEEAYKMGQNARRAVVEEYNWETQKKLYIDEILKLFN